MTMELGTLIRQVSHEREIEPERLVTALEDAISQAARKHYHERGVRTQIDPESGEMTCYRVRKVVATPEEVTDPTAEILLEEALKLDPKAEVGGEIVLGELDTAQLGRIAAQAARQMLFQRVREAERDNIYNEYIGKLGDLVNGIVKRFERGDIVVELGRTEGVVTRQHQVRHERYSQGDRIRAVIVDVTKDANKPQVVLSRTAPQLLIKLLEMEVPEIYDGTVIVKGCVREPGERAKVAVASQGPRRGPGGRLRRHEGFARAGDHARAQGREGRHHPLQPGHRDVRAERAGAGQDQPRRAARAGAQDPDHRHRGKPGARRERPAADARAVRERARRDRVRRAALPGHRKARSKRPPGLAPARLPDRDQERGGGQGRGRGSAGRDAAAGRRGDGGGPGRGGARRGGHRLRHPPAARRTARASARRCGSACSSTATPMPARWPSRTPPS